MCYFCIVNGEDVHQMTESGYSHNHQEIQAEETEQNDENAQAEGDYFVYNGGEDYVSALLSSSSNGQVKSWAGEYTNHGNGSYSVQSDPTAETSVNLTFNINYQHSVNYSDYGNVSGAQEAAIRAALDLWSDVANVTFTETNGAADIGFYQAGLPTFGGGSYVAGVAHTGSLSNGQIVYSSVYLTNNGLQSYDVGKSGFATTVHEIGHALGLKHPGNYNGNGAGEGPFLSAELDTKDLSVMSYNNGDYTNQNTSTQGPMIFDIAAIQALYGANSSYNSGNTLITLTGEEKVWSIWDGAGTDTLDASNVKGDNLIDIREGHEHESQVGDEVVWVAHGANIENIRGSIGSDTIHGNELNNTILDNYGHDTIFGHGGDDLIRGGFADDVIHGGDGNDTLHGDNGADTLNGDAGDDTLYGGNGEDTLNGGAGNDILNSGNGSDVIDAGDGDDIIDGGAYHDTIHAGAGEDTIKGGTGSDEIHGGDDNDTINGNSGHDVIFGDEGDDLIYGSTGSDELHGGDGEDRLLAGSGHDTLHGDAGNDVLDGGIGNDHVFGGAGNDILRGGNGTDTLTGGDGEDRFYYDNVTLGHKIITDFQDGLDVIHIHGYVGNFVSLITNRMTQDGDDVVWEISGTPRITIENYELTDLSIDDFMITVS